MAIIPLCTQTSQPAKLDGNGGGDLQEIEPVEITRDDVLLAKPEAKTKRPPFYKVVLMNDDYTPMDFVVSVLKDVFRKSQDEAVAIMLDVHQKGEGVCGVFTRDVAETKAELVIAVSRQSEYPLQCRVEKN